MPGPDASRLTRQHRDQVAAIGRAVVRPVRQLAEQAPTGDVDGWLERVLPRLVAIVLAGWTASRGRTATYLSRHAAAEGRRVDPVPALWVPQRVVASARVTGPVAFKAALGATGSVEAAKRSMVRQLPAAMQRQALSGSRSTISRTVDESREIIGWRRVVDEDPCAWCAMLASRGAVYKTRATATGVVGRRGARRGSRMLGSAYHDGDECTVEPVYEDEDEPAEVDELYQQWVTATAGTSGTAAIRAWRRYWDARNQDDPPSAG